MQQLLRHFENGHARLFALRLPSIAAEFVQPRRRRVGTDVARRAVAFDLIDAVERNVQPIAALVLQYRDLDHAALDGDRGDAAIDPDAVVEMPFGAVPGNMPGYYYWSRQWWEKLMRFGGASDENMKSFLDEWIMGTKDQFIEE